MSSFLDTPCLYCGQTARRLMLFAMLQDAGCSTSNPADRCFARDDEGEHDFTPSAQEAA